MKKSIAITFFLITILLITLCPLSALAADDALRFDGNGEFKILILSDLQDTDHPQKATLLFAEAAITKADPDLIVLLGDNIYGPSIGNNESKAKKAISAFTDIIDSYGIPFAVVFGNHDDEGCISKEEQTAFYQSYANCLIRDDAELTGCGNYNLLIYDGDTPRYNLWFFDSGSYDTTGRSKYAYVETDQISWYEETAASLKAEYGYLPAMAFQHIIVPEIYDSLKAVGSGTEGAVKQNGAYYVADADKLISGTLNERPCPPDYNNGQFDSWLNTGDIKAAFFGHDHTNDFQIDCKGITLTASPSSGFYSYGALEAHGARVVTVNKNTLDHSTYIIRYKDAGIEYRPMFLTARYGAQIGGYILLGAAVIAVLIAAAVILTVSIIRKRKRKREGCTDMKAE